MGAISVVPTNVPCILHSEYQLTAPLHLSIRDCVWDYDRSYYALYYSIVHCTSISEKSEAGKPSVLPLHMYCIIQVLDWAAQG